MTTSSPDYDLLLPIISFTSLPLTENFAVPAPIVTGQELQMIFH
jgi:hypothetical protein